MIKSLWVALLALSAAAASPKAAPAGRASIAVRFAPDGAHAVLTLDHPVTRFALAQSDVAWDGYAELLTPGLTLRGRTVEGAAPFRRFEIRIKPSSDEHDGQYPAYYRVGDGGVLYAPALTPDPAAWRTKIRFQTPVGQVRYPARGDLPEGFVFIGPRSLATRGEGYVAVTDPAVPAWLGALVRRDVVAAVRRYGAMLHAPLPRPPLVIVKYDEAARNFYVGDVTPGPVVALRFHGSAWARPDPLAAKGINAFILHEAFHFWNGGLAAPAEGNPTWLHEGGAEYASLIAGAAAGLLDEAEVRHRLSEALNRCRSALQSRGDKGLDQVGFLSNDLRYPCGMVLQWAVDLEVRRAGGGRSVMDAWADTIATARRRPGHSYTLADFYSAAHLDQPGGFAPAALIVTTGGAGRWSDLRAALERLGAGVASEVTPDGRRAAMLFHVLRQSCTAIRPDEGFGFWRDGKQIKLQTPQGCGPLAGDPVLSAIEGGDPADATEQTFAAVQRRCAVGQPVTLTLADGRTLAAPCPKPLAPPVPDFAVSRWGSPGSAISRR